MIRKRTQQLSFAQLQVKNCINTAHWLHKINDIIDQVPIRKKLAGLHPSNTGRPAYDPILMFKILLLQQWFGNPQEKIKYINQVVADVLKSFPPRADIQQPPGGNALHENHR